MTKRKQLTGLTADDVIRAIFKAEGWVRGDKDHYNTMTGRCLAYYEIKIDHERQRWVAIPRPVTPAEPPTMEELVKVLRDWLSNAEAGFLDEIPRHTPDVYQNQLVADTVAVLEKFDAAR